MAPGPKRHRTTTEPFILILGLARACSGQLRRADLSRRRRGVGIGEGSLG